MARWKLNKDGVFVEDENPNKRIQIPKTNIRNSNLSYIANIAKERGISRSKVLEQIVSYMVNSPSRITISLYLDTERKRKNVKSKNYRKIPKFYMNPKRILELEALKKKRKVPYAILIDEMILSYRRKFSFFDRLGNIDRLLAPDKYFTYNSSNDLENFINFLANVGGCKDIFINQLKEH